MNTPFNIKNIESKVDFYLKMNNIERVHDMLHYYKNQAFINPKYKPSVSVIEQKLKHHKK